MASRAGRRRKDRQRDSDPVTASRSRTSSTWAALPWATLLVAALCLLGLFSTEIADTDFWWHLKTGQYIAQHHALPLPDPFAYALPSAAAAPGEAQVRHFNLTHEWLSQLLMYEVYTAAGFPGIILVRAALLTTLCALSGFLAARLSCPSSHENSLLRIPSEPEAGPTAPAREIQGKARCADSAMNVRRLYTGIVAAAAAASLLVEFAADRPGIVSFLGAAVFICLLELRRGWWALPPLALLWANCHGGFVMGWIVLAAYCAESLILRRDRRLWPIAALAIAISGINPNGFGVVSTILAYRQSALTANLIEWRPPRLWGEPYNFDLLLYASALVLILSWKKVRPAHWLLFAAFAAASLTAFRNTPLIAFLGPVLIAAYFASSWEAVVKSRLPDI